MVSLVLGLGSELFGLLQRGIGPGPTHWLELALFAGGLIWSLLIGHRLLQRQGLAGARLAVALAPSLLGCILAGLAWWPALFGI
jgi:hypothetical protein